VHELLRPLDLFWRYCPQLAACYVVGLLERRGAIELAAWARDMAGSFYRPQLGDGYLFRGVAWLVGPHPLPFWNGFISLASHLVIEPLRICLIAATLAFGLEHATRRGEATAVPPQEPLPTAAAES
jgi:hypothetical protein